MQETLATVVSAAATSICASDIATVVEATGTVSVPALIITIVNSALFIFNAGVQIYKKIKVLKEEAKKKQEDNTNNDGRAESGN